MKYFWYFCTIMLISSCWPPHEDEIIEDEYCGEFLIEQPYEYFSLPKRSDIGNSYMDWYMIWESHNQPIHLMIESMGVLITRLSGCNTDGEYSCDPNGNTWNISVHRLDTIFCPIEKSGTYDARFVGMNLASTGEGYGAHRCSRPMPVRIEPRNQCEDKGL